MPDLTTAELLLVIATALLAGTVGGITGLGTAIIALPVFTVVFGVREAIPVVSVAMLLNTLSRAVANRDYIDWRVVRWFAIGSVPAAVPSLLHNSSPATPSSALKNSVPLTSRRLRRDDPPGPG